MQRCRSVRLVRRAHRFQSSPVPEDGCNRFPFGGGTSPRVSILTRPGGRVQPVLVDCHTREAIVSILTRPGGRVQRLGSPRVGQSGFVSILTRPGGRVQLRSAWNWNRFQKFQSSPVPEDGCNALPAEEKPRGNSFNPHPSRRTGATRATVADGMVVGMVSILTRPGGRVQLNVFPFP